MGPHARIGCSALVIERDRWVANGADVGPASTRVEIANV